MNKVILHGHIGHMRDLKHVGANNTAILEFSLATVEVYKDKKMTTWHNCKAFGKRAETMAQYFEKGSEILLDGRIELEQWEKDGQKHSRVSIIVLGFDFCGKKKSSGGGGSSAPSSQGEALVDIPEDALPPAQEQDDEDDIPF